MLIVIASTSCSGIVDSIELNRQFLAIVILLGWFELVLFLGRLPLLSVQMEMLKTVRLTFLSFMSGYIVLILVFASSFYILIQEDVKVDDAVLFTKAFISIVRIISCSEVN